MLLCNTALTLLSIYAYNENRYFLYRKEIENYENCIA